MRFIGATSDSGSNASAYERQRRQQSGRRRGTAQSGAVTPLPEPEASRKSFTGTLLTLINAVTRLGLKTAVLGSMDRQKGQKVAQLPGGLGPVTTHPEPLQLRVDLGGAKSIQPAATWIADLGVDTSLVSACLGGFLPISGGQKLASELYFFPHSAAKFWTKTGQHQVSIGISVSVVVNLSLALVELDASFRF